MSIDVLKIGGNQLDDRAFISGMARAVATRIATSAALPVIVHGGGKLISTLQEKLGVTPRTIGGMRVTDRDSLAIVMMVLIGQVNPTLVAALRSAGVDAQGLNGAESRAAQCHTHDITEWRFRLSWNNQDGARRSNS